MLMRPDELIKSIRLPRTRQPLRQYYRKVGTRKAQAISKICFAGLAQLNGEHLADVRIALGSVGPTVVRCSKTEDVLRNQKVDDALVRAARAALASEISPIDDIRSTSNYRLQVALNVLEEFLINL
jgi:CO/xanthine dehydrogenase FAD-binding subunit